MSPDSPATPVTTEQPKETPSKAEVLAKIKDLQAQLKRQEATTGPSGAMPLTPTAVLLDASAAQKNHPDKRLRWVSVHKAQRRQMEGYVAVPETEAEGVGTRKGNLILMALPRAEFERRVEAQKKANADRLQAHNREVEEVAEGIARTLRDKHGVNVRTEDILLRG